MVLRSGDVTPGSSIRKAQLRKIPTPGMEANTPFLMDGRHGGGAWGNCFTQHPEHFGRGAASWVQHGSISLFRGLSGAAGQVDGRVTGIGAALRRLLY